MAQNSSLAFSLSVCKTDFKRLGAAAFNLILSNARRALIFVVPGCVSYRGLGESTSSHVPTFFQPVGLEKSWGKRGMPLDPPVGAMRQPGAIDIERLRRSFTGWVVMAQRKPTFAIFGLRENFSFRLLPFWAFEKISQADFCYFLLMRKFFRPSFAILGFWENFSSRLLSNWAFEKIS